MTSGRIDYHPGLALWRKLQSEMFDAVRDDMTDGQHWDDLILALESMLEQARADQTVGWKVPPRKGA